jgi:hypothetical protein
MRPGTAYSLIDELHFPDVCSNCRGNWVNSAREGTASSQGSYAGCKSIDDLILLIGKDIGFTTPVAPGKLAGLLECVYILSFQMLEKWGE